MPAKSVKYVVRQESLRLCSRSSLWLTIKEVLLLNLAPQKVTTTTALISTTPTSLPFHVPPVQPVTETLPFHVITTSVCVCSLLPTTVRNCQRNTVLDLMWFANNPFSTANLSFTTLPSTISSKPTRIYRQVAAKTLPLGLTHQLGTCQVV